MLFYYRFWGWRFKFYYVKKLYIATLVRLGFAVLQADTDTIWSHDPLPVLRSMNATIACGREAAGFCNAGIVYARPGNPSTQVLLDELAWRLQLFQNHPEVIPRLFPWASPPFYSNSDDQTMLNDVLISALLRNRTFLGAIARLSVCWQTRSLLCPSLSLLLPASCH